MTCFDYSHIQDRYFVIDSMEDLYNSFAENNQICSGLKVNFEKHLCPLLLLILICCNSVSHYHQMAIDSPHELIALQDSLVNSRLSKKSRGGFSSSP